MPADFAETVLETEINGILLDTYGLTSSEKTMLNEFVELRHAQSANQNNAEEQEDEDIEDDDD